nr:MAG TPA: hypothetical protein [Caudoviricetes sp.]
MTGRSNKITTIPPLFFLGPLDFLPSPLYA